MESPERRAVLRSCVGASVVVLAGCAGSDPDGTTVTATESPTSTDAATPTTATATETTPDPTTDAVTPSGPELPVTAYPDEAGDILTRDLSPTADCPHAAALATDEETAELFDWVAADGSVEEFARETDFGAACLLAVRTTTPGQVEYEVDWVARETETTLRVHTTARAVPGPSVGETETRLARVGLDGGPTPSRAVVVRTTDYDGSRFAFATDDRSCPGGT